MQRIANPWTSVRLRDAPPFATLAQLVERNLAKVEVTSSNLVCRSKYLDNGKLPLLQMVSPSQVLDLCPGGGIGRHKGLKSLDVRVVPVQVRPGAPSRCISIDKI